MKSHEKFLVKFIGEQADTLAKMARLDGLEVLAFILQMAKAETDLAQKKLHEGQSEQRRSAN
mgnify:CR=1 FL=1